MRLWIIELKNSLTGKIKSAFNGIKDFFISIPVRLSNENIVISKSENTYYHDLAPKEEVDKRMYSYHKALSWALKNKNVYNIAISGPYGSGKSTIIRSFLRKHPEIGYINISLADFLSDFSGETIDEQDLEAGILKQLFYHVSHKRIPQSRYRKLHKVGRIRQFLLLLFVASITAFSVCFINRDSVRQFVERIANDWSISTFAVYGIILSVSLVALLIINSLIFTFRNRINIREISIDKAGAKTDPNDEASIFNKNMDEIIYFFEETKYNVVFIEDLDRFDSSDIFVKLRELNTILNSYEKIHRRIVFIYAIKDNLFKENDRTKFFDFIIPVIPIISSTNSGDLLIERHDSEKHSDTLDRDFFEFISPYINDMRILENIYNEFILYSETVYNDSDGKKKLALNDKKMFAILVFKNQYPSAFADMQAGEGIVIDAFEQKRNYVIKKARELEASKKPISDKYALAKAEVFDNAKDIKIAMMGFMTSYNGKFQYFRCNNINIDFEDIMDDSFNLERLRVNGYVKYLDNNNYTRDINFNGLTAFVGNNDYIKRYNVCVQGTQQVEEECRREMNEVNKEIRELKYMNMQQVLSRYPQEGIFESDVLENKLLVFLLRNGFLAEDYANYINNFHAQTITQRDMNYILSVRDHNALPATYGLDNPANVVKRLTDKEFEQIEIYNISLVDYLVRITDDDKNRVKSDTLFQNLASLSGEAVEFLDTCLERSLEFNSIITRLADTQPELWDCIFGRVDISVEIKDKYFVGIFQSVNDSTIAEQNENHCVNRYFEADPHILTRLSPYDFLVKKVIESCGIRFRKLSYDLSSRDLIEWVFENDYYELTDEMIELAFILKDSPNTKDLSTRHYSALRKLGYQPLLNKVYKNFDQYLTDFVLQNPENEDESIESVIDIIDRAESLDLICDIITKERAILDDLKKCDLECLHNDENKPLKKVWGHWIIQHKLAYSLDNLHIYYRTFGFDNNLEEYINCGYSEICSTEGIQEKMDITLVEDIINSDISEEAFTSFVKVMPSVEYSGLQNIKDSFIPILIINHYYSLSQELVDGIVNNHVAYIALLLIEYADEINSDIEVNCVLSDEDIDELVTSDKLPDNQKIDYIDCLSEKHTEKSADFICHTTKKISKTLFDKTWDYLVEFDSMPSKIALFFNQLNYLGKDDIIHCLSDLPKEYKVFAERRGKHKETLLKSSENERFVKRMKEIGLITSFKEITEGEKDLYECWVKQNN